VGVGVTISGTVGASIEVASFGIPALAMSLETDIEDHLSHNDLVDFTFASVVTRRLAQHALENSWPAGVDILNVNVPQDATPETAWRVTRLSRQRYFHSRIEQNPDQDEPNFIGYERRVDFDDLEADSDIQALLDGVVSLTPLSIDLTAQRRLPDLAGWLDSVGRFEG
jgi:5'-nucleotidase